LYYIVQLRWAVEIDPNTFPKFSKRVRVSIRDIP